MAVERLRQVLDDIPGVKIAVLFGSAIRGRPVRDVDVGICLDSKAGLKGPAKMANVLEDALGVPVGLASEGAPQTEVEGPARRVEADRKG